MAALPFSPPTVLRNIDASLPQGPENSPQLKTPHDAIAIFVHACMLSAGFRLVGLSEDDRLETPIESADPKPLPARWNSNPGNYGFHYTHTQSFSYLIKVNRLGNKTVIMGLDLGNDKTTSFDITTTDFLSESFFPYTLHPSSGKAPQQQPLENGFVSASHISDLANVVKIHIVQKLVSNIQEAASPAGGSRQQQQPRNQPREDFEDPLRYPRPGHPPIPAGERPPGFDDEYEILQPPRGFYGGRNPLSIGADDLNPPGIDPNVPLRGPLFGEGRGGFGGVGPMGGMHPTGDHPMFGGQGDGVLDPRFPPGARYDPVGPGDAPMGGFRGPRGPRGPGGGSGGFGGYGSNDFI